MQTADVIATPEDVGVLPDALETLLVRARREIDDGILPSCQIALAREGRLVAFETFGEATPGTRYVLMSCTKGIVSAAVWLLLGEGKLRLDQPVAEIIPEFGSNGKDVVTLEQVLRHTAGFPYAFMSPDDWNDPEKRDYLFSAWKLEWEPDSRYVYHSLSAAFVLAELINRVSGSDYRDFIRDRITAPLGLTHAAVGGPGAGADVAELVICGEPATPDEVREAWGIENMPPLEGTHLGLLMFGEPQNITIGVPGAGGVSTAADMALFYQALLHNHGELWNADVLGAATTAARTHPDPLGIPTTRALGVQINGDHGYGTWYTFGKTNSPGTFGHDGAGGMIAWADPATGLSFSYLTNGLDDNLVRQKRRCVGLSSRAAVCAA